MNSEGWGRPYKRMKREKIDKCNICGEVMPLTYDHIPPKCLYNDLKAMPIESLSGQPEKYNQFCAQNGIKYRSLCDRCNNGILGKYDAAIKEFVLKVKEGILDDSNLGTFNVLIRVNSVAKAICGHFLAMKNKYDNQSLVDQTLREYVLCPSKLPPDRFKLLIRYYPFSTAFNIRDVAIVSKRKVAEFPDGLISCISAYPVAFILSDGNCDCGMIDLFAYCTSSMSDIIELTFDCKTAFFPGTKILRHPKWPCNISDEEYGVPLVICSESAIQDSVFASRDSKAIRKKISRE